MTSLVLVTGASGFVGSHLVDRLAAIGAGVRVLARRTSRLAHLPATVERVEGDLASGEGLERAVDGVEMIFHLAGVTKAIDSRDYYLGNVAGTRNLLRAVEQREGKAPRFLHVSSLAAIGPSPDGVPLREDAEPHPLTHYGKSKLEAERLVRASALAGHAVIVRPPVVYGPRDTDVYQIFLGVSRGLMVTIGREPSLFSAIYVKDLADALIAAAAGPCTEGRTYFVADPAPVSWTDLGETAARVMGRKLRVVAVPPALAHAAGWCSEQVSRLRGKPGIISREKVREARCRYWLCDPNRAREEFGYTPRRKFTEAVAETLAWYKSSGWLKY